MGYYLYVAYRYVKNIWKLRVDINFVYLILVTNFLAAGSGYWLRTSPVFVIPLIIIFAWLVYYNFSLLKQLIRILKQKFEEHGFKRCRGLIGYVSSTWPLVLHAWAIFLLFPLPFLVQLTFQNGSFTNTIAHYAGYVGGLYFPLLLRATIVMPSLLKN